MFSLSYGLLLSLLVCSTNASQEPQQILNLEVLGNTSSSTSDSNLVSSPEIEEQHCDSGSCGNYYGSANQTSSGPWTYEPKCVEDEESFETFCVYTNASFANGRGISFFTTPAIARKVLELPAFTQRGLHDNVNVFDNPPWEVKFVSGRGNGLFATRTLHRGDLIISTTPVGIYMSDAFFPDFPLEYQHLHVSFDQLPKATQDIFMDSAANYEGDPLMERINTNAFSGDFEGSPHFLMYPETARMNHDCRPNAMYYFDPATLIHSTHASRTIEPGEEITLTYINMLQPYTFRQENLKEHWGFECSCNLCSLEPHERAMSDARIRSIIEYQEDLSDWSRRSQGNPTLAEELIILYEREEIHAGSGTAHMLAALAYNGEGRTSLAKWHAKKAIKAGLIYTGTGDANATEMKTLIDNPESHWSYMARLQRRY
ncbi:hypothetical protein F5884DRAFT_278761 [Xylogone sp. PMI_703]|nr:hypothetical protein F5884DRAFT_278761 [Xylogone sp. PMI_703]